MTDDNKRLGRDPRDFRRQRSSLLLVAFLLGTLNRARDHLFGNQIVVFLIRRRSCHEADPCTRS